MIGFTVQTAVLLGVLYLFPVFGPIVDEAGIVGATVISILASAALLFVVDLWRAPVLIDRLQREDLSRAVEVASDILNSEERMKKLGEYHTEGKRKLASSARNDALKASYDEWCAICESYIERNLRYSKLHEFRNCDPIKIYNVLDSNHAISPDDKKLRNSWEGKLAALDRIISMEDIAVMPSLSMKGIVDASEHPIYEFLLPKGTKRRQT